jgi:hypothetical protein
MVLRDVVEELTRNWTRSRRVVCPLRRGIALPIRVCGGWRSNGSSQLSNPLGPSRTGDLPIWGPEGTSEHLGKLHDVYGRWIEPRQGEVRVCELEDGEAVALGSLTFSAHRVMHARSSLAYRVESNGRSLCFSGDSARCPGLEKAARGVDVFLCECAALEGDMVAGHVSPTEVGQIAAAAAYGQVVLTHLYDHVAQSDPLPRVQVSFAGPVRLADDGMCIDLER